MTFAKGTKTAISTTEEQIKAMLRKAGAATVGIMEEPGFSYVAFHLNGRSIRFKLPLPKRDEERFVMGLDRYSHRPARRDEGAAAGLWVQACRERYRQLHLCIKAKLVSVEEGVELFDDAFLSQIVTPDGTTVGEQVRGQMAELMDGRPLRPLISHG